MSARLPAAIRPLASGAWRWWIDRALAAELRGLARSGRPVVAGPWLGEVGFELLYWRPFLDWAIPEFGFDPARVVAVSRGGPSAWYRRVASRYRDALELLSPEELRGMGRARVDAFGEQKQMRLIGAEETLVTAVAAAESIERPVVLHPGVMFRAFSPFWWHHADQSWVRRHARFGPLPEADAPPPGLPDRFTAVKFYFNEAFPPTGENRAAAGRIVRALSEHGPVVSLSTGLRVDDHLAWEEEALAAQRGIAAPAPSTNLAVQDAIVARASAWVGTYGGFAYLAPSRGIPARAVYSNAAGFSRRHLELAESVFAGFGANLLQASSVTGVIEAVAS